MNVWTPSLVDAATMDKTELATALQQEVDRTSLRDVAKKADVSKTAIDNIIKGNIQDFPKLETLDKLALYFKLPLWRVIQMAGIDPGVPRSISDMAQQLTSLADRMPEIEPILEYLLKLYPGDLRGVIAYLETVDRLRNTDHEGQDEGAQ